MITSLKENVPSHLLASFVSTKRLARTRRRAIRRPPLNTRCVVIYDPSPQGPNHIRSITGGAQALDFFLANEALSLSSTNTLAVTNPRSTPIKRCSSAQAPTRIKKSKHTSSPPPFQGGMTRDPSPPTSPARKPRRPHNNFLQIITVESDTDRESTPSPKPYTSLVLPTSPWNTRGKNMIGVHNHTGAAIPPTLLSPERYKWLYEAHTRLDNRTDFTQDLLGLMSRYPPRAKTINPQSRTLKLVNHWAIPPNL